MRIAGYIEHSVLKITIFQMENKYAVKFEAGLFEQTYKFRAGGPLNSVEDIRKLVDSDFTTRVLEEMREMREISKRAVGRLSSGGGAEDEFEDIL